MDLPHLRAFLKVAELGSVTRAAEALHQTQPAVSGQLAKLEHELGRPLFERLARGVRLTEAGLLFRDKVEPWIRASLSVRGNFSRPERRDACRTW